MVQFNPENRPGQFGLDAEESRIVLIGLETQLGYVGLMPSIKEEATSGDPRACAHAAVRAESGRLLDRHNSITIVGDDAHWIHDEHLDTVLQSVPDALKQSASMAIEFGPDSMRSEIQSCMAGLRMISQLRGYKH